MQARLQSDAGRQGMALGARAGRGEAERGRELPRHPGCGRRGSSSVRHLREAIGYCRAGHRGGVARLCLFAFNNVLDGYYNETRITKVHTIYTAATSERLHQGRH